MAGSVTDAVETVAEAEVETVSAVEVAAEVKAAKVTVPAMGCVHDNFQ